MIISNKGGGRVEKYDSYGKKHASNTKYSKQNKTHKANQKSLPLYVLLLPTLILLICFTYIPMYGIIMAFKDYSPALGIWNSPWVGMKHFIQYFHSYQFGLTVKNTLYISLYSLLVGFPLPIALAILCNQMRIGMFKKVFQVTTYLPHFISTMVMCGMILIFYHRVLGLSQMFYLYLGWKCRTCYQSRHYLAVYMCGVMYGSI
ncbi:hypothetical protein AAHB53_05295 [Niallia circulans]